MAAECSPGREPGDQSPLNPEPARAGDSGLTDMDAEISVAPTGLGIILCYTPGLHPGLNSSACFAGSLNASFGN